MNNELMNMRSLFERLEFRLVLIKFLFFAHHFPLDKFVEMLKILQNQ